MRSRLILSLAPVFVLLAACGDDAPNEFTTANMSGADSTATDTGAPADLPETGGQDTTTAGDGDGDPGDGDPGDGDPDPTDTGVGMCGDGVVDIGEQCDGVELNGFTCADLGYSSGDLGCDPVMCTYDASGCVADPDGGSGGTSG